MTVMMYRKEEILNLDPISFKSSVFTPQDVLHIFDALDAGWIYDNDPQKPHAELTSGMHSNGFFDCLRILRYPNLCEILARQLVKKLDASSIAQNIGQIDWVIGSPYAAITFSYEVARALNAIHGFVEKDTAPPLPTDPQAKRMLWARMTIPAGARVLDVEELITTSGTLKEVRRAVEAGNKEPVNFLPVVGALVHRPPKLSVNYEGISVVALVEKEVQAFKPEECPWCKAGSKALRPKTHWAELTGKA